MQDRHHFSLWSLFSWKACRFKVGCYSPVRFRQREHTVAGGLDFPNTLRLAMVLDNTEYAERISNHFRNGGVAVRSAVVQTATEALEALKIPTDIIICEVSAKQEDLSRLHQIVVGLQLQNRYTPIIALLHTYASTEVFNALEQGASNCIPMDNTLFFDAILKKEWRNYILQCKSQSLISQIKESNKRCDNLIDSSKEPIAYIHQGMHIRANSAYLNLFGFEDFDEAEAMSLLDLIQTDVDAFKAFLKKQHQDNQSHVFPAKINTSDAITEVEMEFSPAWYEGEECLQVVIRLPHTVEIEKNKIDIDPVTQVLSRPAFVQQVKNFSKNGVEAGILICSLDTYSDLFQSLSLGSLDVLLFEFSQRLTSLVPSNAITGRIGESKFAVWTQNQNSEELEQMAQKIHTTFDNLVLNANEHSVAVPAKISGIYWRNPNEENVDTMLSESIKILLSSKSRIQIAQASQFFVQTGSSGITNIDAIEEALAHKRIEVYYSPIQPLHGQLFSFYIGDGVLYDDNQNLVSVEEDISNDLLKRFQHEKIKSVLHSLSTEHITPSSKILIPLRLWGNDEYVIDQMCSDIRGSQLPAQLFVAEFQEKDLITKLSDAQNIVHTLKSFGMEIGLGGFGSTEQSAFLLQHINPQWVRFEKNLLSGLANNQDNQRRLKELTSLAQDSGKKVIASDVDDAMSMATLFASNVEYTQGDFISPPISHLPKH